MLCNAGIGDILIAKMILQSLNLKNKVAINKNLIRKNRYNSADYYAFVEKLENILFANQSEPALNIHSSNFQNKITNFSLVEDFKQDLRSVYDFDYITLSTKARFDGAHEKFIKNDLSVIVDFFRDFSVDCSIILLGEKDLNGKLADKVWEQYSFYEHYMDVLSKKNKIIDLTSDKNLIAEPNWDMFTRDLSILHNSKLNIMFGYGGNMVMSTAISNSNIGYISDIRHPFLNIVGPSYHRNLGTFLNELKLFVNNLNK